MTQTIDIDVIVSKKSDRNIVQLYRRVVLKCQNYVNKLRNSVSENSEKVEILAPIKSKIEKK